MTQGDAIDDGICYYLLQDMKLMSEPTSKHTEKLFIYYICICYKAFLSNFYLARNKNLSRISLFTELIYYEKQKDYF